MSRVTYYNKLSGRTEWTINEIIALAKLIHWKPVEIEVGGQKYRIKVTRKKIE